MRVLVTGAAGFIGTNLCTLLLDEGVELVAVDNLSAETGQLAPGVALTAAAGMSCAWYCENRGGSIAVPARNGGVISAVRARPARTSRSRNRA
jgi:nucleoside-diphosphate-sugar epimerase